MTDVLLIRTPFGFKPADDLAADALKRFKQKEVVKCKLTKPRNVGFHRRFFALMNVAFENQDKYLDLDTFLTVIKYMTGHCDWLDETNPHGKAIKIPIPKSISFAKMDETEFREFYGKAFNVIVTRILGGVDEKELERAVIERVESFA